MWAPQLRLADAGWRIIAPHVGGAGGHAGAAPDPARASMDEYAAEVVDLLDALHVDAAVVGGLSMGGYVAFALLRLAPAYVHGLILADTRPQADTSEAVEGRKRLMKVVEEAGAAGVASEMIPKLLGETTRRSGPAIVEQVRSLALANSPESIAGMIGALMRRPDSTPLLATIRVPTLVIVGTEDTVTPPAIASEMHAAIAGSELVVIPAAGHLSNLEQPDAFTAALARFLEHRV